MVAQPGAALHCSRTLPFRKESASEGSRGASSPVRQRNMSRSDDIREFYPDVFFETTFDEHR
jgi:hypothetical protein